MLEWKAEGETRKGDLNEKRPRSDQGYRYSWIGRRRGARDVRRGKHRHPGRHNGRRLHSGVDHVRYARQRLVAQRLGLAARMGLAPVALAPLVSAQLAIDRKFVA